MAQKKYKPALFELIDESTLNTPSWFYNRKKGQEKKPLQPQQENEKIDKMGDIKAVPADTPQREPQIPRMDQEHGAEAPTSFWDEKRVGVPVKYLLFIGIGIVTVILLAFWTGSYLTGPQQGAAEDNPYRDQPASEELENVTHGPVRDDLWPSRSGPDGLSQAGTERTAQVGPARTGQSQGTNSASETNAAGSENNLADNSSLRRGRCLILCGHANPQVLKPVQNYFIRNGLPTLMGQLDGRHVLVTEQTFNSSETPQAKRLKEKVSQLGARYNDHKPKDAPPFLPGTFESAYPINVDRIEYSR